MNLPKATCSLSAIIMLASIPMTATLADSAPGSRSASEVLVKRSEMTNWLADGERGLWIQVRSVDWFYARFRGACHGVHSTNSIEFDTGGADNIRATSAVTVPGGERCPLYSVAPSNGPPEDRYVGLVMAPQEQG